jgi:hypothetical protein
MHHRKHIDKIRTHSGHDLFLTREVPKANCATDQFSATRSTTPIAPVSIVPDAKRTDHRVRYRPAAEDDTYLRAGNVPCAERPAELRGRRYKPTTQPALRATKISTNHPPSAWWPGGDEICNLYLMTGYVDAIRRLFVVHDRSASANTTRSTARRCRFGSPLASKSPCSHLQGLRDALDVGAQG